MVLEGVHLVPGMITTELEGALVVQCVLAIHDEEIHRTHFWIRDATPTASGRSTGTSRLPEIRMIQEYIVERAATERRAGDRERVAERRDRRGDGARARAGRARRATASAMIVP